MLTFLVVVGVNAARSYQAAIASTEYRTKNVVDLIQHQLESTITTTELVLDSLVDRFEADIAATDGGNDDVSHDTHLTYMASRLPNNPWLIRLDTNGVPVIAVPSTPTRGQQVDDPLEQRSHQDARHESTMGEMEPTLDPAAYRAYVEHHNAEPTTEIWLGPPIRDVESTAWGIGLSRRIEAPGGAFAGVALVLFAPDALMMSARAMELGNGAGLGIVEEDGTPRIWLTEQGEERPGLSLYGERSVAVGASISDVQEHIRSRLQLDSFPDLYATVSIPRAVVRDIWLRDRIVDVLLVISFGAVLLMMAFPASRLIVKPIRQVEDAVGHIGSGDFSHAPAARSLGIEEVRRVSQGVDMARQSLAKLTKDLDEKRQQAEAANRMKAEFLANMSHELRTPLNAILGFSEVILKEAHGHVGSPKHVEYLQDIHASGSHLLNIINDILDVSKIEVGEYKLHEADLDVAAVVNGVLRLIQPRADTLAITLSTDLASDLPCLWADERALKQILLNLLSNAVKFSTPDGRVTVTAWWEERAGMHIQVSDTGIGMAPEHIGIALTPFRQVDSGHARRHEGTGLGLPLVKSLVELQGGALIIESAIDEGTKVTFRFPPNRGKRLAA